MRLPTLAFCAWLALCGDPLHAEFRWEGPEVGDPLFTAREPEDAVWAMLQSFGKRSPEGYVSWMTEDFLFTSNDPACLARFPQGLTREDEREFATHLFEGGGRGPDGEPLPTANRIVFDAGPMTSMSVRENSRQAIVQLDRYHVRALLSNGRALDFGNTRCEFVLIQKDDGWRIRRWKETVIPEEAAIVSENPPPIPSPTPVLTLRARPQRSRGVMLFDITLPRAGALLETFDVTGRRISRRDLMDLRPGRYTITLDAAAYPASVYWARLKQGAEAITRKVVWVK